MEPVGPHAAAVANLRRRGKEKGKIEMGGEAAGPQEEAVMIRRDLLAACMTCPICNKLLSDATTVSECLHTFCRKCIFEKLTEEEVDCCPVCDIELGCTPLEKLRPDHNLQDVRAKIFPHKRRKVNAPEPSITLPIRRKERSLSSLVVDTPRVAIPAGSTGRRTKTTSRRRASVLRGLGPVIAEPTKKETKHVEDSGVNSGSSGTLSKITQIRRQNSSDAQPSIHAPNKNTDDGTKSLKDKSELWPLNYLLEAANSTKHLTSTPQCSLFKEEQTNGLDSEVLMHKIKARVHPHNSKVDDDKDDSIPPSPVKIRARRVRGRKKRDLGTSTQVHIDAAGGTHGSRNCPIWLSLVPSMDWNGNAAVPLTPSCYLRIKDGNLTVSFIEKYILNKFNLPSEAEVEITCRGRVVGSTSTLQSLTDLWVPSESSRRRFQATLGTSAKDFVMVLNYSWKPPAN